MTFKIPRVQTQDRLTNQLQQNICKTVETQFLTLSGTFTAVFTDSSTNTSSGIASWQRATAAGPIFITWPFLSLTSTAVTATIAGLPTILWPDMVQIVLGRIKNNGTTGIGLFEFMTNGVVQLFNGAAGGNFTASGSKGIPIQTLSYMIGVT